MYMRFASPFFLCFFFFITILLGLAQPIHPLFAQTDQELNTEKLKKILTTSEYAALKDIIVAAKSAYAYIPETGTVLFSKNEQNAVPLASIIKLLVAVTATDILNEADTIEVKPGDTVPYGEYGLVIGEKFNFQDARHMMLIVSSNDMAWTIARVAGEKMIANDPLLTGKNPQTVFLEAMNTKASSLGLNTIFSRSITGLDFQNETVASSFGSAYDIAHLVSNIVENYPQVALGAKDAFVTVSSNIKSHTYQNTNKYLGSIQNLMLSKTGYTRMAGGNLAISRKMTDDSSVIVVVLGSGREQRFYDTLAINDAIMKVFQ
jgi:D-alanyl-D-alanine carboxypeptidase